mmetsp:Transcript_67300/g.197578  ORF Transcript_67300/g.197578 Transcript_67300/m.197578 type:complete len:502 (+) Transcript_67300:625-2130(+)
MLVLSLPRLRLRRGLSGPAASRAGAGTGAGTGAGFGLARAAPAGRAAHIIGADRPLHGLDLARATARGQPLRKHQSPELLEVQAAVMVLVPPVHDLVGHLAALAHREDALDVGLRQDAGQVVHGEQAVHAPVQRVEGGPEGLVLQDKALAQARREELRVVDRARAVQVQHVEELLDLGSLRAARAQDLAEASLHFLQGEHAQALHVEVPEDVVQSLEVLVVQLLRNHRDANGAEEGHPAEPLKVAEDPAGHLGLRGGVLRFHEVRQPRMAQDLGAPRAAGRIGLQQGANEVLGLLRDAAVPRVARQGIVGHLHLAEHVPRATPEGRLAGEHHVGQDTETPDVALAAVGVPVQAALALQGQHLRRRVQQRAGHAPHLVLGEEGAEPPVYDHHVILVRAAEADVLRLQVTVRDLPVVRVAEGSPNLTEDVRRKRLADPLVPEDAVQQLAAGADLHDKEHVLLVLEDLEEPADVWMVQLPHDLSLAVKRLYVLRTALLDLLDCH